MNTLIILELSIEQLSDLIDLIESAADHDVPLTEKQFNIYKYFQEKEAEEIMRGSN